MREIKFRLWAKFEGGNFGMLDNDNLKSWSLEEVLDVEEEDVLMQYTGIKDKNGNEVCEGDIIRVDIKKPYFPEDYADYKVVYRADEIISGFYLEAIKMSEMFNGPLRNVGQYYAVIGNVYENPQLLES